jgi:hypothetical protein
MDRGQAPMTVAVSKGYRPGAIGRIAELHAAYYHREAALGLYFESRVARELAEFCERYDDSRDGLWLAMNGSDVEGSIAIDGLGAHERGAHLRWFISSDRVRGSGAGTALLLPRWHFAGRSATHSFTCGHLKASTRPGISTRNSVSASFTSNAVRNGASK